MAKNDARPVGWIVGWCTHTCHVRAITVVHSLSRNFTLSISVWLVPQHNRNLNMSNEHHITGRMCGAYAITLYESSKNTQPRPLFIPSRNRLKWLSIALQNHWIVMANFRLFSAANTRLPIFRRRRDTSREQGIISNDRTPILVTTASHVHRFYQIKRKTTASIAQWWPAR